MGSSRKIKVDASAMGYAITFLLLVGLITSGVLFVSATHKRIQVLYQTKEHLLMDNLLSLKLAAKLNKKGTFILPHASGDSSLVTLKEWGVFNAVSVKTWHGFQKVEQAAITADTYVGPDYVLYLPQSRNELKVCGETRIEGTAYLSDWGIKRGYLAGKDYQGDKLIYGDKKSSDKTIPNLSARFADLSLESFIENSVKKDFTSKDSTYSFHEPTTLHSTLEAQVISNHLSGNVIIHSFDSIYITKEARLEHVILISPKIRFEAGFIGCCQVIAHRQIVCEKDVKLNYPSVLVLNETNTAIAQQISMIRLEEKSQVLGGILLTTRKMDHTKPVRLSVKNALVAGFVYNVGETELIGELFGSLITQSIYLNNGGGAYHNYLLDAKISKGQMPKEFIVPNWLMNQEKANPVLLACF